MITQTAKAPITPRTRSSVFIGNIQVRGSRVTADARVALCETNLNLAVLLLLDWNVVVKYACTSAGAVDVTYVTPTRLMVGQLCANPL